MIDLRIGEIGDPVKQLLSKFFCEISGYPGCKKAAYYRSRHTAERAQQHHAAVFQYGTHFKGTR